MENGTKKANKITTVLFCIWVCIAFFLAQVPGAIFCVVPLAVDTLNAAGGDMNLYQTMLTDAVMEPDFLGKLQCLSTIGSVILMVIWYYFGYAKKEFGPEHGANTRKQLANLNSIMTIVFGALALYAIAVFVNFATSSFMPDTNSAVNEMLNNLLSGNKVLGFVSAVILAPIGEELLLRGIILRRAKRAYGLIGCLVISGLFFGALHLNPIQGLYAIPLGVFYGYLAYKFNSVIPTIICHAINNLFATIMSNLGDNLPLWGYAIMLVVCGIITVYFLPKVEFIEETEAEEVAELVEAVEA